MVSILELRDYLVKNNCDFEILQHDSPIITTQDAAMYFDIEKAVPVFITDTGQGLIALIVSSRYGRIDFAALRHILGFPRLKMADKENVKEATGYKAGSIPLIGHGLPCVIDEHILTYDYVFGGTGDEFHTLKIAPDDIERLNNIIARI